MTLPKDASNVLCVTKPEECLCAKGLSKKATEKMLTIKSRCRRAEAFSEAIYGFNRLMQTDPTSAQAQALLKASE